MNSDATAPTKPLTNEESSFDASVYPRPPRLSLAEAQTIGQIIGWTQSGKKGWPKGTVAPLSTLLQPLYEVLDHLGAVNTEKRKYTIRTTVICLLIRAMHQHQCTFWALPTAAWLQILGEDYYAYVRYHGVTANARQQLVSVAYLLCDFNELGQLGRLAYPSLANKIFGRTVMDQSATELLTDLHTWGYTRQGNTLSLRASLAEAMLTQRSPKLTDLSREILDKLYQTADAKATRRGLVLISYVLVRRNQFTQPIGRDGQAHMLERIDHRRALDGVPPDWLAWCDRWYATTTLQPASRISTVYRLFQVGRWLAKAYPDVLEPADWTAEICTTFVAAVDRAKIGDWSHPISSVATRIGQPLSPATKDGFYRHVRTFFNDCQEWGWITRRFNPIRSLRTPRSIRVLIGPNPRVIEDATWAKLVWAGLNLSETDLAGGINGRNYCVRYPAPMVQALAIVWLFGGLRRDEIQRLPLGCIRWQADESLDPSTDSSEICLLDVPVNKTGTAFTKPVDATMGRAIERWESTRPPQPTRPDRKTGQAVQLLFCHRGRLLSKPYLNAKLIPLLCQKAGVPLTDARGAITSHRARATIASQLYNAKEPLSLVELQAWLGHASPDSTQHYAKVSPTRLVQSYKNAGYFARNLRAVEVLIDQEAIQSGAVARGEPWKYYDLGHGLCTYDFFDQCAHRMACAKCSFYRPKESAAAQLLEGKSNLLRMLQEIPLLDDERAAVEDGVDAMNQLLERLAHIPTPSTQTPASLITPTR